MPSSSLRPTLLHEGEAASAGVVAVEVAAMAAATVEEAVTTVALEERQGREAKAQTLLDPSAKFATSLDTQQIYVGIGLMLTISLNRKM